MTDRELLELAAKAAGLVINTIKQAERDSIVSPEKASLWLANGNTGWNSLTDDGDALRLAVKLQIVAGKYDDYASACALGNPVVGEITVWGHEEKDPYTATRRAIVRAAAEIGKAMP